jgi:HEAT repeat protein
MSQKRYAYLIGANGPQTARLKYAEKDAKRLAGALLAHPCSFTKAEWTIAENRQSTLNSLHRFVKQCEPSDLLIVHFSGHADNDGQLFLLCNDTDIDNYYSSAIGIDAIKFYLDKCKARYKVLVLDCCRAGAAYSGAFKGDQDIQTNLQQSLQGSVNVILLACSHREKARELETLGGGAGFLSWALTTACTSRFDEISQDNHSLSLADIRRWIPIFLREVNSSLEPKDKLPEPRFVIETRGEDDGEIWLTEQRRAYTPKFASDDLLMRKKYLESVYNHYSSVKLPLGPEGFSLHAIFQPLELRRVSLAAEDLNRKQRRPFLGENLKDEKDADYKHSRRDKREHAEEKEQPVIAENGDDALNKSPQRRLVILGGPGTGKTTTLKYFVGCRAKEALADPNAPLPIFLSLADLARFGKGLQSYLAELVEELDIECIYAQTLWKTIEAGRAFICLDSLDEVEPQRRQKMIEKVNEWATKPGNTWVIGSRFTEYKGGSFKHGQFAEWELQPMSHQLRLELAGRLLPELQRIFSSVPAQSLSPATFVKLLEDHPQAAAWGENPLLFSLAAVVFVRLGTLPSTRTALYQEAVEAILENRENNPIRREMLRRVLARVALEVYQSKGRMCTLRDLIDILPRIRESLRETWNTEEMAQNLIASGILEVIAHKTYSFLHQTFQEYLVAVELAQGIVTLDPAVQEKTKDFAWSKRTYSRWTEILCLLSGVLVYEHEKKGIQAVQYWLQRLAGQGTQEGGDPGNLGLVLTIKSLREITAIHIDLSKDAQVRNLERDIIALWLRDLIETAKTNHETKEKRLRDLASDIALLHPTTLKWTIEQLTQLLLDENRGIRWTAVETLGLLGASVPIDPLITILCEDTWNMKMAVLRALKALKKCPPIEPVLELLQEDDRQIREAVIQALDATKDPRLGNLFVDFLLDKDADVQKAVVQALGNLGEMAPISLLLTYLQDNTSDVKESAAKALGMLGEHAPINQLLAYLYNPETCSGAAKALGMLGQHAPIPSLIEATYAPHSKVRIAAAEALGIIKTQIAIEPLINLLEDKNVDVKKAAIEALEFILDPVADKGFNGFYGEFAWYRRWLWMRSNQVENRKLEIAIEPFLEASKSNDIAIRRAAIKILGILGNKASIEPLTELLQDDNPRIRIETIYSLALLGAEVPIEIFLKMLEDNEWEVYEAVIRAFGTLGERVPIDVLIATMQRDCSTNIIMAVLEACGMLGQHAPIELVVAALDHDDSMIVNKAIQALGRIGQWIKAEELFSALEKNKNRLLIPAIQVLEGLEDEDLSDIFVSILEAEASWDIRKQVINAISNLGTSIPVNILSDLFYQLEGICGEVELPSGGIGFYMWAPSVCVSILEALVKLEENTPIDLIAKALTNKSEVVRFAAIKAVDTLSKYLSDTVLFEILEDSLEDESLEIYLEAVRILYSRGINISLKRLKFDLLNEELLAIYTSLIIGKHALLKPILEEKTLFEWLELALNKAKEDKETMFACIGILDILGRIKDRRAANILINVLESSDYSYDDYEICTESLGKLIEFIPVNWFVEKFNSGDDWIIEKTLWVVMYGMEGSQVLEEIEEQLPIDPIIAALYNQKDEKVRAGAAIILGILGECVSVEPLLVALSDVNDNVRIAAIYSLKKSYPEALYSLRSEAKAVLERMQLPGYVLSSPLQSFVAEIIGEIGQATPDFIQKVSELLHWPHWQVQLQAIESLRKIRRNIPDDAINQLLYLRQYSQVQAVHQAADDALAELLSLETSIEDDQILSTE